MSGLVAQGTTRAGSFDLHLDVSVLPGETVAVLGPNGAGKTTLLQTIAGLHALDAGQIALDGRVLDDPVAATWAPPEDRSIGVVFQDLRLFPSADVADNVAFGLRASGLGRRQARARAVEWLDRLGLAGRGDDRVGDLSGGEAQRVALARALAPAPRVLLLDEPLSALDADVRATVRRELRDHLRGHEGPRIVVTHDPLDAAVLADRVVVVEEGNVVASGQLADLIAQPRSAWAAELAGTNLLEATARGTELRTSAGGTLVVAESPGDGAVLVVIRPSAVALHAGRPEGSPRNVWSAAVTEVEGFGERRRVHLDGALPIVAEITVEAAVALGIAPGSPVWASVKATDVTAYPT